MSEEDQLPRGWCFTALGELAESCLNGFGKRSQEAGVPTVVLRLADVQQGMISLGVPRRVNALKEEIERYRLRHDDLIAIRVNGSPNLVGRLIRFNGAEECILYCDHFIRLRLIERSLSRFLRYYGDTHTARRYIDEHKVSTAGQNTISQGTLERLRVPLPPLREQQRIADIIDELLSDLDAGVAALERAQRKLALYRATVLKAAVEGALTAEWRQQHPATEPASVLLTRILAERRRRWEEEQLRKFAAVGKKPPKNWKAKYKDAVAPDATSLSTLPEGWCWGSVGQLGHVTSGQTPPGIPKSSDDRGTVTWFRVGDMNHPDNETWMSTGGVLMTSQVACTIGLKTLPPGSIIFPKRGGAIATNKKRRLRFAAACDLNLMSVTPNSEIADYLWLFFQGLDLAKLSDGSNVPQINHPDIAPIPVPLPPRLEQMSLVETVEDQLSVIDHIEADLETKLKTAQALRQSILRHAFTGQLVPQDPNDEPASELLKRIAAQREARAREALAAQRSGSKSKARHRQPRVREARPER